MQLITLLSILQGIMVYILDNPPQDNASDRTGSPEANAVVRLNTQYKTLFSLFRRQGYATALQALAR
jgi:hypothetical protein